MVVFVLSTMQILGTRNRRAEGTCLAMLFSFGKEILLPLFLQGEGHSGDI